MAKEKADNSNVISFRVPKEMAARINKQAKKQEIRRSAFVKSIFVPAFEEYFYAQIANTPSRSTAKA